MGGRWLRGGRGVCVRTRVQFATDRLRQSSEFGLRALSSSTSPAPPRVLFGAVADPVDDPQMSMFGMNSRRALGPVGNSVLVSGSSTAAPAALGCLPVTGFMVASSDRLVTTSWCVSNAFTSCATVNLWGKRVTLDTTNERDWFFFFYSKKDRGGW